jgi:ribosomal protein S16
LARNQGKNQNCYYRVTVENGAEVLPASHILFPFHPDEAVKKTLDSIAQWIKQGSPFHEHPRHIAPEKGGDCHNYQDRERDLNPSLQHGSINSKKSQ